MIASVSALRACFTWLSCKTRPQRRFRQYPRRPQRSVAFVVAVSNAVCKRMCCGARSVALSDDEVKYILELQLAVVLLRGISAYTDVASSAVRVDTAACTIICSSVPMTQTDFRPVKRTPGRSRPARAHQVGAVDAVLLLVNADQRPDGLGPQGPGDLRIGRAAQ